MNFIIKSKSFFLAVAFLSLFLFSACTKKPSPDEINALNEARSAAEAAERQVSSLQSELSQLQNELEREKQTLSENQAELEAIRQKLAE